MSGWPSEEQLRGVKEDSSTCLRQRGRPASLLLCSCPPVSAPVAPPLLDPAPPAVSGPRSGFLSDPPGSRLEVRGDSAVAREGDQPLLPV